MRTGWQPAGSLLAACLVAGGLLAGGAGAAAAGDATAVRAVDTAGGCVTGAELRQVRHGLRKARVHRIFGTRGRLVYRVVDNEEKRAYPMCDGVRTLVVTYLHGELGYRHVAGER